MVLSIISCLIVAVVVAGAAIAASRLLTETKEPNYPRAIGLGITVGLINFFSPRVTPAPWLAVLFLIIMVGIGAYVLYWWHMEGSELMEMVWFLIIEVVVFIGAKAAAEASTLVFSGAFSASVVRAIPTITFILYIGFMVADYLSFRSEMKELDEEAEDEEEEPAQRTGCIAAPDDGPNGQKGE